MGSSGVTVLGSPYEPVIGPMSTRHIEPADETTKSPWWSGVWEFVEMYSDAARFYDLIHKAKGRDPAREADIFVAEIRRRTPNARTLLDVAVFCLVRASNLRPKHEAINAGPSLIEGCPCTAGRGRVLPAPHNLANSGSHRRWRGVEVND